MHQLKPMDPNFICVGDVIKDSPMGDGQVTGLLSGCPQVNGVAVAWLMRTDGVEWRHDMLRGM